MSAPIPTSEPTQIRVGETLSFTRYLADFSPSDGWSLEYNFASAANDLIQLTSTASSGNHLVTATAATTSGWVPGDYFGTGMAVKSGEKHTIFEGWLKVKPDLASLQTGEADQRTQAKRILDAIEATIEGRAGHDILNSTIEGTQIQRMTAEDLLKFRDRYAAIVAAETAKASGKNRRRVLTQFTP